MRVPNKSKDTLSKVLPLRWSLGSKDRRKHDQVPPQVQDPDPAELVQYLESGRRPRCTKDSIVALMNEPRSTKEAAKGRAADSRRSSSSGTVGCVGKVKEESFYTKVPEGQKPPIDKKNSRTEGSHSKEESRVNISSSSSSNTLTRKKDSRRHSSSKPSKDAQTKEGFDTGVHPSYSSPNLHGTLTRRKGDKAKKDQDGTHEEKAKKGEVPKSHEGLLSFFKGNFLKKDTKKSESDSGRVENKEERRKTSLTVAMSNGVAGSRTRLEESKSNGYRHQGEGLANGKVGRTPTDIRRSQSSSNITAKPEPNMRRTASLHRNAMSTAPRNLTADKPSYDTLQRNRYSTTSLGRKKTVPESSFWRREIQHSHLKPSLSGEKKRKRLCILYQSNRGPFITICLFCTKSWKIKQLISDLGIFLKIKKKCHENNQWSAWATWIMQFIPMQRGFYLFSTGNKQQPTSALGVITPCWPVEVVDSDCLHF